jgi:hypothetical protein
MPRCCMDAWAVVMSDQAIKQATHARTIELSSGTLDPVTVVTVLSSTITSASPGHRIGLERLLQEIPIWRDGGCVVRQFGHGDGRDKGQSRDQTLHSSRARGYGVGVLECGVVGHRSISVEPNTNQQD